MAVASLPLRSERRVVLTVLLVLAATGWALVVWQAAVMEDHDDMGLDLTMGMAAPLFLAMWVAMMFPASAPIILAFARAQARKREQHAPYAPM